MPDEISDKVISIKEIYNDAVKSLELLNVLIPQIGTGNPKITETFLKAVSDTCFELGSNISVNSEYLEGEP